MTSVPGEIVQNQVLAPLQNGEMTLEGQFTYGSNYTFLANITLDGFTSQVVYKPAKGERPLWDFPARSLSKREAAAYIVSESLGWGLVPPTVYRKKAPLGPGSVQLFIEHDPDLHYFTFEDKDKQKLRPTVVFDLLINNADRKGGHLLCDNQGHIWSIDHGICFHVENKLRTVLWDFSGEEIPGNLLNDISNFVGILETKGDGFESLKPYLRISEINALARRGRMILDNPVFPFPGKNMYYPWPPV